MAKPRGTKMMQKTLRPCRDSNPMEPLPDCSGNPVGEPPIELSKDERSAYDMILTMLHDNTACRSDALFIALLAQDLLVSVRDRNNANYKVNHRTMLYNALSRAGLTPSDRRKLVDTTSKEINPYGTIASL